MVAVHRGLLKLTLSIAALGAIAIAWLSQTRKIFTQNRIEREGEECEIEC